MLCAAGVRGGTQQGVPALRGVNAACGEGGYSEHFQD